MSEIKVNTISPIGSTLTLGAPVAGLSVASGITVGGIGYFSSGVPITLNGFAIKIA